MRANLPPSVPPNHQGEADSVPANLPPSVPPNHQGEADSVPAYLPPSVNHQGEADSLREVPPNIRGRLTTPLGPPEASGGG